MDSSVHSHPLASGESDASLFGAVSEWGADDDEEEHLNIGGGAEAAEGDAGIKLPPGTPLQKVPVLALRPTQLAVGLAAVEAKQRKVRKKASKGADALEQFLAAHPVPVVLGPAAAAAAAAGGEAASTAAAAAGGAAAGAEGPPPPPAMYLIDHHHLACALWRSGVRECYVGVAADFSTATPEQFWHAMARRGYLWPHRHTGDEVPLQALPALLPASVAGLEDDAYRSLAALVRKAGGFAKSTRPFAEFVWANHLRSRVPMVQLRAPGDVERYVNDAVAAARAADARELPGFGGGGEGEGEGGGGGGEGGGAEQQQQQQQCAADAGGAAPP